MDLVLRVGEVIERHPDRDPRGLVVLADGDPSRQRALPGAEQVPVEHLGGDAQDRSHGLAGDRVDMLEELVARHREARGNVGIGAGRIERDAIDDLAIA
ncbi:MAG: hypothetical protein H0T79_01130 [Deltaproteobacteria bacterium]|nr:hypothetical protein [Deltaproteobacteria bacterium]